MGGNGSGANGHSMTQHDQNPCAGHATSQRQPDAGAQQPSPSLGGAAAAPTTAADGAAAIAPCAMEVDGGNAGAVQEAVAAGASALPSQHQQAGPDAQQ